LKFLKLYTLFLFFIFLTNCSTSYQPKGTLGGYSEEKILDNLYRVEFAGNRHSKPEKIQNYLLYRCAELTQEMGFTYFAIVSDERGVSFETIISMSEDTSTTVSPDFQTAASSTKYTGVYVIKFLNDIDKKNKNAVFNVDDVISKLSEIVKK